MAPVLTVHLVGQSGFKPVEEVIEQADYLYGSGETEKLYHLLVKYRDSDNAEFLWRLARASRDLALLSSTSAEEKKRLMYEAFDYSRNALEKNESSSAAHKWYAICISDIGDYEGTKIKIGNAYVVKEHLQWYAICISDIGDYEGTKIKIGNAYVVKEHLQRAIELNPKDATAIHVLGLWCFAFAELPWYQRKIAAMLFASPPSSTYEEALGYFLKAEEGMKLQIELGGADGLQCFAFAELPWYQRKIAAMLFASPPSSTYEEFMFEYKCNIIQKSNTTRKNLLMLGKSYMMLKDQKSSLLWLSKAKDYPAHTEEDKQV
ncbi:UNVERIFIED_CONTAM: hypothetical protein FKN15_074612 [Acipenser sinensis]